MLAGILVFITGIANIVLIKKKSKLQKEEDYIQWRKALELKFLVSLLLTPAINPLVNVIASGDAEVEERLALRAKIQFWLVLFILVYSACVKIYREDVSNNFELDPFEVKFEQFKQKY